MNKRNYFVQCLACNTPKTTLSLPSDSVIINNTLTHTDPEQQMIPDITVVALISVKV